MSDIQPFLSASFIHPGMALVGALCAAVPIVIHFLNRRRFKRIRWAAMEFLLTARKKTMRRMQFEQILLLLLRCAVMMLIGAAVARPLLTGGAGIGTERRARAIILDNSYSMQQRDGDQITPLQQGKRWLQQFADQFDTTDSVSFVLAGAASHPVIDRPVIDHDLFKQRVKEVNAAREVIMRRVVDIDENLSSADLPKIHSVFGKLNGENALKGEKIQDKKGSWIMKL